MAIDANPGRREADQPKSPLQDKNPYSSPDDDNNLNSPTNNTARDVSQNAVPHMLAAGHRHPDQSPTANAQHSSNVRQHPPYDMHAPATPATAGTAPRTTRRNMLRAELAESLRRNLLWERQESRARAGSGSGSGSGSGRGKARATGGEGQDEHFGAGQVQRWQVGGEGEREGDEGDGADGPGES